MKTVKKKVFKKEGAALIIVLFTLVIVSVFMSLMYTVSRKYILSETKERQSSLYSQYLRTTLDFVVSPFVMGKANNTTNGEFNLPRDIIYNNLRVRPVGGNILDTNQPPTNPYVFDLYYMISDNNLGTLTVLNRVSVVRRRITRALTIIPTYDITINTVVTDLTNLPNNNFDQVIGNLQRDHIKYTGRALATIVQRTPYNISTNTAYFVKHPMMWVPFAADPFVAINSANNIDRCVGMTQDYNIKGDLSTPNLNSRDLGNAFRNTQGNSALNTSGLAGVWGDSVPNGRLVSGGSATGYANIAFNNSGQNQLSQGQDLSIKNYNTKRFNNGAPGDGFNEGILPGADNNGNPDLSRINNNQRVIINVDSVQAVLVGSKVDQNTNTEQVVRVGGDGVHGGLIEMVWPVDQNNNFMNTEVAKAIVDSYPPKYATIYVVPNGNEITIFGVGEYSKRKVKAEISGGIVKLGGQPVSNLPANKVQIQNDEIKINLNNLTDQERKDLSAFYVNGGNVVLQPASDNGNNGLYYIDRSDPNNPKAVPYDFTVIATRFGNTDNPTNRVFYRESQDPNNDLGGWSLPQGFNPNTGVVNLGSNGANYILPAQSNQKWDNRRQVIRALEGNVIVQNFKDDNYDFRRNNTEAVGFVGYTNNNGQYTRTVTVNPGNGNQQITLKPLNIISQNYVVLNYSAINNLNRYYLSANIISYKGSLTIPDRDIYRWLMDGGRYIVQEYQAFENQLVRDSSLKWYGKYIANFGSVEGILNPANSNEVIGFSSVDMTSSDISELGRAMPMVRRQDWRIKIGSKEVILYDIVRFEINK